MSWPTTYSPASGATPVGPTVGMRPVALQVSEAVPELPKTRLMFPVVALTEELAVAVNHA
jgi:hypothetical protein